MISDIDAALEKLRAEDARLAADAETGYEALTRDEGLDGLTQYDLQYFLWYTLPTKFVASVEHQLDIARALGRLLQMVGLSRYAEICCSAQTEECIQWGETPEGRAVYERAQRASGVMPPDTNDLHWSVYMGMQEFKAWLTAAVALEMAIMAGDLKPGSRGWEEAQRKITSAWLNTSNALFEGRTPLSAIHAERIESWVESGNEQRRILMREIAETLVPPVSFPTDHQEGFEPLLWLLRAAQDGITLTPNRNLNRAFVQEAAARWDWWDFPTPPSREADFPILEDLHQFLRDRGFVRRFKGQLVLSPSGRRGLQEPPYLWRMIVRGLSHEETLDRAVWELVFAQLLTGKKDIDGLESWITAILSERWGTVTAGREVPVSESDVSFAIYELMRIAEPLGIIAKPPRWPDRALGLTEFGRATALAALRARATAPVRTLYR